MTDYAACLAVCVCVCFGCFAFSLHRAGMKPVAALVALPLCVVLGAVFAKLFYVLLLASSQFPRFGWGAFLRTEPRSFSVVGGCAGVLAGVMLTARLTRQQTHATLDAFAPTGALLLGAVRFCEGFLGTLGYGASLDAGALLARFPFAVQNKYDEWYAAVYILEGCIALAAAVYGLTKRRRVEHPFEHCLFFLALTQIFCESLRSQGMMWGFVHVEQVLCAAAVFLMMAATCRRLSGKLTAWTRYRPCVATLAAIAMLVGVEFAKAKANSAFLAQWSWVLMAVILAGLFMLKQRLMRLSTPATENRTI